MLIDVEKEDALMVLAVISFWHISIFVIYREQK